MQEGYYYEEAVAEIETLEETTKPSFFTWFGRSLLLLFVFVFPLFVLPTTIAPLEINKGYLAPIVGFVLLIAWFGGALQEGRVRFAKSWALYAYGLFLGIWLISTILSQNIFSSFWGLGSETTTFFVFLTGGIFLFSIPALFDEPKWIYRVLTSIILSFVIIGGIFLVRTLMDVSLFSDSLGRSFNPVGSWSILGAFFAFMVALLLPFFGVAQRRLRIIAGTLCVIALLFLALTNFLYGIIGVGVVSLVYVALLLSRRMMRSSFFGISLAILLLVTLLILIQVPMAELAGKFRAPPEVSPSFSSTAGIIQKTLEESPLVGTGPNTFALLWERYKPRVLNDTPLWSLRFSNGNSLVGTIVAEGGMLGGIALVAFMLLLTMTVLKALGQSNLDDLHETLLRSTIGGVIFLWFLWWVHPTSIFIVYLTFIMTGIFLAMIRVMGLAETADIDLFSSTERGFVASLAIIFLLIGSIVGIYFQATRYIAGLYFVRGLDEFNTGKGLNSARITIAKAMTYDAYRDQYWRTLAQLEIKKLERIISSAANIPREEAQEQFRVSLAAAIDDAKKASDLGPRDSVNWMVLGQVYEVVIPFVPGSSDLALENYNRAKDLAPTNPAILLGIARSHLATGGALALRGGADVSRNLISAEQDKAVEALTKATELKSDFAEAHFLLAQIYASQGKIDEAITRAEAAYQLAPRDIGVLFQLGLLYYQKNDLERALAAFSRAIELNPGYSNALYFAGLIDDRQGRKEDALVKFTKIRELNPDNKEVLMIIENLNRGKPALDATTPPPPEKRPEPPVKEDLAP